MGTLLEESQRSRSLGFLGKYKKYIIIFLGLVLIGGGIYYYFSNKKTAQPAVQVKNWETKKSDLKISVEADGKVVAEDGVELSFSVSGDNLEIEKVFVKEGDTVKKGDKIATVKTNTLELSYRTAYASYQSALADYNETVSGASEKEIADAKDKISSAEISLEQAKISLENTKQSAVKSIYDAEQNLQDAKENLDDNPNELTSKAVKSAYSEMVDTVKSVNISLENILLYSDKILGVDDKFVNDDYENYLGVKNVNSKAYAEGSYEKAKAARKALNSLSLVLNDNSSYSEIEKAATQANEALVLAEDHLYDMQVMLDASIVATDLSQSSLDGFKSSINSNRSSVNSKITSLRSADDKIEDAKDSLSDYVRAYEKAQVALNNAKSDAEKNIANAESNIKSKELSLEQTKRDYQDLTAPLTASEAASARSKLTSASVNLSKAKDELDKATLTTPIDGVVSMLGYKAGDIIVDQSSGDPMATIINNDTLFIEVNIEEADISNIKVGQKVYATFDALNSLKLEGEVTFISLTSNTDNSGIVTYLVRIVINNTGDAQIREGMTAFVDFVTAEAKDVLTVPVAAVSNINGNPSVQTASGEIKTVVTGFTDGKYVEVISGLNEGDKIVYY